MNYSDIMGSILFQKCCHKFNPQTLKGIRCRPKRTIDALHWADIIAMCDIHNVSVRLVGGSLDMEGRVEIYRDQAGWGTICDDGFENYDTQVVCRMLGFSGGEAVGEAFFGEGTGYIFLDNLGCFGNEFDVRDCHHNGWGEHNCQHSEDAGVICGNCHSFCPYE